MGPNLTPSIPAWATASLSPRAKRKEADLSDGNGAGNTLPARTGQRRNATLAARRYSRPTPGRGQLEALVRLVPHVSQVRDITWPAQVTSAERGLATTRTTTCKDSLVRATLSSSTPHGLSQGSGLDSVEHNMSARGKSSTFARGLSRTLTKSEV